MIQFIECTSAQYNSAVDENKIESESIYFISDTGQIFKGLDKYSTLPAVSKNSSVSKELVNNINFKGEGFTVEPDENNPGTVIVSMPFNLAKMNSSYYNSTGGTTTPSVSDNSSYSSRYVALPGDDSYSVGNWSTTSSHNVLNKGVTSLSYSTADYFWIPNTSTKFIIKLIKGDGTEVSEETSAITGNGTYSTTNCSVVISNFTEDFMGNKAKATININIANMLGGAGRFSIKISHVDGGNEYSKTQSDLFYDDDQAAGTIGSGSIALNNTSSIKYLSGVEYYGSGTTVDITLSNIDGVFNKSFVSNVGSIVTNCTSNQSYTASDVAVAAGKTLATAVNTDSATSLSKSGVSVSSNKYLESIQFTSATCSNGWNTNTLNTVSSVSLDKPLDSYPTNTSTKTLENFQDENYRLHQDLSSGWNSQEALATGDLKCGEGTWLFRNSSDSTSDQVYVRNFGGTQSSGVGIFTFVGTGISESNFITNNYFDMEISLNGSTWYSIKYLSTEASNGIRAQKATYNLDKSTKTIYYALPAGVTTDTNTGVAGNISNYGIFFRLKINNSAVKFNSISIEFK